MEDWDVETAGSSEKAREDSPLTSIASIHFALRYLASDRLQSLMYIEYWHYERDIVKSQLSASKSGKMHTWNKELTCMKLERD